VDPRFLRAEVWERSLRPNRLMLSVPRLPARCAYSRAPHQWQGDPKAEPEQPNHRQFATTPSAGISGQAWACSVAIFLSVGFLWLPARDDDGSGRRFRVFFRLPRFLSSKGRAPAGCIWFPVRERAWFAWPAMHAGWVVQGTPAPRHTQLSTKRKTEDVRASIEQQARCYMQMAALWMASPNRQNCTWILADDIPRVKDPWARSRAGRHHWKINIRTMFHFKIKTTSKLLPMNNRRKCLHACDYVSTFWD